jgi:AcrR family transcriptional regulator
MVARAQSGRAARTRRDIVSAAIVCWSADNTASLGSVADTAGVGRTTVNRYFSDRAQLVAAVDVECRERFTAACSRARPDEGTGLEALQRVCTEIVQLGEVLGLIFADNALVDPDTWDGDTTDGSPASDPIGALVLRGQSDGSLAVDLPADWVATQTWTSLFAAWLMIQSGTLTTHEVGRLLTRTLARGVAGAGQ